MSDERRYADEEVVEIFEAASTPRGPEGRSLAAARGLTLAELQEIGREVGLAPDRIAEAALAIDRRRGAAPRRTDLGMPVSVTRSVDLPRAPTDREWDLLVGEMRATFNAQGREGSRGDLRHWRNGNLHAFVEPTEDGYRFRMGTTKGDAAPLNRMGIFGIVLAWVMIVVLVLTGDLASELVVPAILGAMGVGALSINALRLPRWALEREEQMEYIAARAQALIRPAPDPAGAPGDADR